MATIVLRFVTNGGSTTLNGTVTVSDANAARILAAEQTNMKTTNNQTTADALARRFVDDMIGDTKTVERTAAVVPDIPVT